MADCLMITQNDGTAKPVGVIQGDASDIKYDSNTSTKQKIDNVESSIPTSASVLPYSSGVSTKQKIDEVNGKIDENTVVDTLSFTRGSKVSAGTSIQAKKYGKLVVASGYVEVTSAMVKDDIIASFSADEINVFLGNFFTRGIATDNTGFDINLKGRTRNIVADGAIASGKVLRFQIVGITI